MQDQVNGKQDMRIAVFGMGHVGLPTALGFAELGYHVTGVDTDAQKIAALRSGKPTFYEPGMEPLLRKHQQNPSFELTDDVDAAIRTATVLFICVGTPQRANGEADLSAIEALARAIARNLNGYKLIVEKSTVPALTGRWLHRTVVRYLSARASSGNGQAKVNGNGKSNGHHNGNGHALHGNGNGNGNGNGHAYVRANGNGHAKPNGNGNGHAKALSGDFEVASCPEFLQEGKAIENIFRPDRVVCGVPSERARQVLEKLYAPLGRPILFTDVVSAEVIKHAANAFLATKVSFINLVADICEAVGADVTQVASGIGMDPRIGTGFLQAGIGFGGYCFPKDLKAFIHLAEENNIHAGLLRETDEINSGRVERILRKIRQELWIVEGKTLAVFGLAFKAGTDDVRESPAVKVVQELRRQGAVLRMYDRQAAQNAKALVPPGAGITYCSTPYEAARDAHAVLVLTEEPGFRKLDFARLKREMQLPLVIDGRNILDPATVRAAGCEYVSVGRGTAVQLPTWQAETKEETHEESTRMELQADVFAAD